MKDKKCNLRRGSLNLPVSGPLRSVIAFEGWGGGSWVWSWKCSGERRWWWLAPWNAGDDVWEQGGVINRPRLPCSSNCDRSIRVSSTPIPNDDNKSRWTSDTAKDQTDNRHWQTFYWHWNSLRLSSRLFAPKAGCAVKCTSPIKNIRISWWWWRWFHFCFMITEREKGRSSDERNDNQRNDNNSQ